MTGASGQVGTLVCRRLAGTPIEVLLLKQDDWADAIGKSEAVIHLAGTVQPKGRNSYDSANDQTTAEVGATNAALALGDYQCDTQRGLGPPCFSRQLASRGGVRRQAECDPKVPRCRGNGVTVVSSQRVTRQPAWRCSFSAARCRAGRASRRRSRGRPTSSSAAPRYRACGSFAC